MQRPAQTLGSNLQRRNESVQLPRASRMDERQSSDRESVQIEHRHGYGLHRTTITLGVPGEAVSTDLRELRAGRSTTSVAAVTRGLFQHAGYQRVR